MDWINTVMIMNIDIEVSYYFKYITMEPIHTNYIYLLHEREHIRLSENVYKVGMTRQCNLERFNNYPKGSILLFQMECNDCKFIESIVLEVFNTRFYKRAFYGNEYFEGNKKHMIEMIYLIIANEDKIRECSRDRSKYIESILNQYNNVDYESSNEHNEPIPEDKGDRPKQYHCEKCDYYTSRSFNYVKHIMTDKHKLRSENTIYACNSSPFDSSNRSLEYRCPNCNRKYMAKRSLWRHLKECQSSSKPDTLDKNTFDVFTTTIRELCNSNTELNKMNQTQHSQMIQMFTDFLETSKLLSIKLNPQTK